MRASQESRRARHPRILRGHLLGLAALAALPTFAAAQSGPPPAVREAVDAVVAYVSSGDDGSLQALLAKLDGAFVDRFASREALLARLEELRLEGGGPVDGIDVQLDADGARARLAVANDGPPVPEGMEGRLFESTVSVRAGGDAGVPHLGLGLYIVRLIAQFHGGGARVENKPDNEGVVVTVALPLAARAPRGGVRADQG